MKAVFDKFAVHSHPIIEHSNTYDSSIADAKPNLDPCIRADGLHAALLELGVHLDSSKVDVLMLMTDLDENGGLNFTEFKRAVQQQPRTELEQWASLLPLAGMLARSLPVSGGPGDQPLRDFSRLADDEIETAVHVFSEGLKQLLSSARASTRQMFDSTDKKALEAAKDLADGVSASSKFKTFKMSTGTVEDYHDGLTSRIGMIRRMDSLSIFTVQSNSSSFFPNLLTSFFIPGAPHPNFFKGMRDEHCVMYGCDVEFTTRNYGLMTTPLGEYEISTSKQHCPEKDMMDKKGRRVRVIRRIEELRRLKLCRKAGLTYDEILAVVRAQYDPIPIMQTHLIR